MTKKLSVLRLFLLLIVYISAAVFPSIKNEPSITPMPFPSQSPNTDSALVTRVIDGDTIELEGGRKVRYIGINTPEIRGTQECFGREAYNKNRDLVEGKYVRLEKDVSETDRYGRLLRYVYIDGIFINDILVRTGYANAASYPPDIKYQNQFRESEKEARHKNIGLWSTCSVTNLTGIN